MAVVKEVGTEGIANQIVKRGEVYLRGVQSSLAFAYEFSLAFRRDDVAQGWVALMDALDEEVKILVGLLACENG